MIRAVCCIVFASGVGFCEAFLPQSSYRACSRPTNIFSSQGEPDNPELQWSLFRKHQAPAPITEWKGIWTTYDYMGDVMDEAIATVVYEELKDASIQQAHRIVTERTRSDCKSCFDDDDLETQTFPVANYNPQTLSSKRIRVAANTMVAGPSLLRSGVMATELCIAHKESRLRAVFQHAPVWEQGIEPGSVPPQGLKLARVVICKEVLVGSSAEHMLQPRPIPPFSWHKIWGGTSWTWGPQSGNRGWALEEVEDGDDWHGNAPPNVWNLRLPGGYFIQVPRVITDVGVGLCRLAWLPDDDTLLRVEAGVSVLQPQVNEEGNMIGFEPPSLVSLRSDVLDKRGDLEGSPQFAIQAEDEVVNKESRDLTTPAEINSQDFDDSTTLDTIKDSIQL